jgi:hypothetical protein
LKTPLFSLEANSDEKFTFVENSDEMVTDMILENYMADLQLGDIDSSEEVGNDSIGEVSDDFVLL